MANIFDDEKVAVSPIIIARDKIENLTDRPNTSEEFGGDGMTGAELKKAFDKIGIYVATRLKNLTETLKSADAGNSIGITGWNGELTTIKEMLMELSKTIGASKIGTGIPINGVFSDLQSVLDNLYMLISSYELDDVYDIKMKLEYDKATGDCEAITRMTNNLNTLNEYVDKIQKLLSLEAEGNSAIRIDNIEGDVEEIFQMRNASHGIATLDGLGKLQNELDASKITSGLLPLSCIPDSAFERTFEVATEKERLLLTKEKVQDGDIVIVTGNPDKWYKVIDDKNLDKESGYREIIGGTTAVAQMSREFDANYKGANSIAEKFAEISGQGRSVETIKKNADDIATNLNSINELKGTSWNGENVKNNASQIQILNSLKSVFYTNVTVSKTSFLSSTKFAFYGFCASIPLIGVTAKSLVEVIFNHNEAVSASYSPIVESYDGGVKIYARFKPTQDVVIPKIIEIKEGT